MGANLLMARANGHQPQASTGIVLVYHAVAPSWPKNTREARYWIATRDFQRQIDYVRASLYHTPSLHEFWNGASGGQRSDVVFTFDDGRSCDYESTFPLLAEAGIRGCFFVNTTTVGTPGYLTWSQIREMQAFGMSFQSHSHNHIYLTRLTPDALREELTYSKRHIEDRVGRPVDFLAAPFGDLNRTVLDIALDAGYMAMCSGSSHPARARAHIVDRVCVLGATSPRTFRALLARDPLVYAVRTLRSAAIYLPKQLFLRAGRLAPPPLESAPL